MPIGPFLFPWLIEHSVIARMLAFLVVFNCMIHFVVQSWWCLDLISRETMSARREFTLHHYIYCRAAPQHDVNVTYGSRSIWYL